MLHKDFLMDIFIHLVLDELYQFLPAKHVLQVDVVVHLPHVVEVPMHYLSLLDPFVFLIEGLVDLELLLKDSQPFVAKGPYDLPWNQFLNP